MSNYYFFLWYVQFYSMVYLPSSTVHFPLTPSCAMHFHTMYNSPSTSKLQFSSYKTMRSKYPFINLFLVSGPNMLSKCTLPPRLNLLFRIGGQYILHEPLICPSLWEMYGLVSTSKILSTSSKLQSIDSPKICAKIVSIFYIQVRCFPISLSVLTTSFTRFTRMK